jgi:hypothetical protein
MLARSCEANRGSVSGYQTSSSECLALCFVTLRRDEIDWAGLRAAAVAIGIRKAARQAARDLPPDEQERFVQRAMKRCSREKWLVKSQQDKADAVVTSPNALSANVRKRADVLSEILAEHEKETRISLARSARRMAKDAEEARLRDSPYVQKVAQVAGIVHKWNDQEKSGNHYTLNMLSIG